MRKPHPQPPEVYQRRLALVRSAFRPRKIDSYFVQDRGDQYWLTGFTGEDGSAIVTEKEVVLLTDGRFDEAADIEAPWARKVLRKVRGPEANGKELKRTKARRIGFNPDHMKVREFEALRKLIAPAKLVAVEDLVRPLRMCKDADEIDKIRAAIRVAQDAFKHVKAWVKPGFTEREIAAELDYQMARRGAQEPAFGTIVAAGPNSSLPHYEPGNRRWVDTEPLLVDWGARVDWYRSDLTRVLWVGSILSEYRTVFEIVREAQAVGIAAVRPGVKATAVDAAARRVIDKSGYGKKFNHALGHGIGVVTHEGPRLGKKSKDVLRPGMVVTVEPGIYLPGIGGVRIEDDVLVTETGHEVLSSLPTDAN
jgi:Xaa-Pro aminopeptidase